MKNLIKCMAIATTLTFAAGAQAGDADAGKKIAEAQCGTCHGLDGASQNPGWPILAGQYETYLVHALKSYKDGSRKNAIMAGFAAGLSKSDMKNVAAWYAQQEAKVAVSPSP